MSSIGNFLRVVTFVSVLLLLPATVLSQGIQCDCCQVAGGNNPAVTQAQLSEPMPMPGKKVGVGSDYYFLYGFTKKPAMGTAIMKVELFTKEGKRDTSLEFRGNAGMPSMRGAHDTGDQPFKISNKGDYLLPVNLVMPGEWEMRFSVLQQGKVIYRGAYTFRI